MANRNVWAAVTYLRHITRNILTPNNVAIDQNVTDGIERGVVKQQKLGCQNQGGGGGGGGGGERREWSPNWESSFYYQKATARDLTDVETEKATRHAHLQSDAHRIRRLK